VLFQITFCDLKFHNTQSALLQICYVFMQVLFVHIVVWTSFMFFLGLDYCCLQMSRYFGLEVKHHFKAIYIIWFMCVWTRIIFIGIKMVAHDKGYITCKEWWLKFQHSFCNIIFDGYLCPLAHCETFCKVVFGPCDFKKFVSMQPMTPSCMLAWEKCFWKMHKPSYIKSLLGFKCLGGGVDKSGERPSLKSGYHLESWKPLGKFSLLIILSFSKKPLNMSMPSTFVITINIFNYRQKYRLDQLKQFHVLWYKLSHLL